MVEENLSDKVELFDRVTFMVTQPTSDTSPSMTGPAPVNSVNNDYLDIISYKECYNDFPNLVKECRGLVYYNDQLILKSLPFVDEYDVNDEEGKKRVEECFSPSNDGNHKYFFFPSYEGSLIRVFNFNGTWYTATNKKLDANKSRWGTEESFGAVFKKAIPENFYETLDHECSYFFYLLNTKKNRIVCQGVDTPKVYHIGTIDSSISSSINSNILNLDATLPGIEKPEKLPFTNVEEVYKYVQGQDYSQVQGVIIFEEEFADIQGNNLGAVTPRGVHDNIKLFKILAPGYKERFELRANTPSVLLRYLQLRKSDLILLSKLKELYPEEVQNFSSAEDTLTRIYTYLHKSYLLRYVKKEFVYLHQSFHRVLLKAHGWHHKDKAFNIVTLAVMTEFVDSFSAKELNIMINAYKELGI
jgi:hypothetical protein